MKLFFKTREDARSKVVARKEKCLPAKLVDCVKENIAMPVKHSKPLRWCVGIPTAPRNPNRTRVIDSWDGVIID